MSGIVFIPGIFHALVNLNRRSIHEFYFIAGFHKPVHQPVPVICRFHRYRLNALPVWRQLRQNNRKLIWQTLFEYYSVGFILNDQNPKSSDKG